MNFDKIFSMISFRLYVRTNSTLSITPYMICCIIKSIRSTLGSISLCIKFKKNEEIETVTKCESVILQPDCFKVIIHSESRKTFFGCSDYHFTYTMIYRVMFYKYPNTDNYQS